MMRYRAILAYDGAAYYGFQRQTEDLPTIQSVVEGAIAAVTGQAVTLVGAGRTDTGVHAIGQVIAFDADWQHEPHDLLRAINSVLPEDIALQTMHVHEGFHPRFDALSRVYRYSVVQSEYRQPLLRGRAWQMRSPLDADLMGQAAMLLLGEHDFGAFGNPPSGESTIRVVMESHWKRRHASYGLDWTYTIEANAFLRHMVRRIVSTLVDVGRGALTLEAFEALLQNADASQPNPLAPPQGLVLETVKYPDDVVF